MVPRDDTCSRSQNSYKCIWIYIKIIIFPHFIILRVWNYHGCYGLPTWQQMHDQPLRNQGLYSLSGRTFYRKISNIFLIFWSIFDWYLFHATRWAPLRSSAPNSPSRSDDHSFTLTTGQPHSGFRIQEYFIFNTTIDQQGNNMHKKMYMIFRPSEQYSQSLRRQNKMFVL